MRASDPNPDCAKPPPPLLLRGVTQFNRREFFQCHETLEELWKAEPGPVRELYQGILQIGVGFYHLARGNYRGALYSLDGGLERLRPFPPECQGVLVGRLSAEAEAAKAAIVELGEERSADLDARLIPLVHLAGEHAER